MNMNNDLKSKTYLANAFSLSMVKTPCQLKISEVPELPKGEDVISCVGHADTANVLGVECNRVSITLNDGDTLYVAQLEGGRLPEGATTLPQGFAFKYLKVEFE
jgi:hypothetical protein